MKIVKRLLCMALALSLMLVCFACGRKDGATTPSGDGEKPGESQETPDATATLKGGTIDIFLPIDTDSETALTSVGSAYARMMKNKGITVRVNVSSSQDPQAYAQAVDGLLKNGGTGDIIQANLVSQYYGTDKLVDFTPYLNTKNDYNDGKVWKSTLREDAYRTDDKTHKIYNLSMEGNALVAFYNKKIFEANNIPVPTDWTSLISTLDALKSAGYDSPLGLNYDSSGIEGNNFGWLMQMYSDQYFRDMVDAAHSRSGDYSYISEVDEEWEYSPTDTLNDSRRAYTYNFTRVVNEYFKDGSVFNTSSARYADMMGNLRTLASYASRTRAAAAVREAFQKDALSGEGLSYGLGERCAVYLTRLDYITDHQSSIGGALGKPNGTVPISELEDMLGWFKLPAMPSSQGEGSPAADNVRTLGGPDHHPIALVNSNADKTALCMDFLKYLFSPEGFDTYYAYYKTKGKVCAMQCYLQDYTLPQEVTIEGDLNFDGDCSTNPYGLFGFGFSENSGILANGNKVTDTVRAQISAFLTGSSAWSGYGANILGAVKDGFANYASWRGLKQTSLDWYTSGSVNYAADPMQD